MMGLFEHWPYVNFHELNLDWIIKEIPKVYASRDEAQASADASAESAAASKLSADAALASQEASYQSELNAAQSAENAAGSAQEAEDTVANTLSQINLLQSRVDNIIPQGTQTEGNTELIDIRVAADGTIYDSAGNSVRGQIRGVNTYIDKFTNLTDNLFYLTDETTRTIFGVTITVNPDQTITFDGTVTGGYIRLALMGSTELSQNVDNDTDYIFDRELVSGEQTGGNPFFVHSPAGSISNQQTISLKRAYTFTDEVVWIRISQGYVFTNATYRFTIKKGSTLDDYVPHLTAVDYVARNSIADINASVTKNVKILGIGNSYTRDCMRWLWKILKECGYTNVVVGHGYWGASTLAEQYASLDPTDVNHSIYQYWKYTNAQDATKTNNVTLDSILTDESWDIVIFQQQSDEAGQYDSFVSNDFDINDFVTHVKNTIDNNSIKIGLSLTWSHAHGYIGEKFAEYYNSDPATQLTAIKAVIPQVANHMSQCDYIVNAGIAVEYGRNNTYLNALGTEMLRTDKNHLYYGVPSFMCGLVYALAVTDIDINELTWYPTAADEGVQNIDTSAFLAYLAKQCAKNADNYI